MSVHVRDDDPGEACEPVPDAAAVLVEGAGLTGLDVQAGLQVRGVHEEQRQEAEAVPPDRTAL